MLSINNNMGGLRAQDALAQSNRLLGVSLERLSSGVRINRAEDDAAGLMVRDRFQAQVLGLEEGIRNIQQAQNMIQVAEAGINKVTEALQQMRALAVRAADDNLSDEDRGRIQQQIQSLLKEINERAASTSYNGHKLLDGSITDPVAERLGRARIQGQSLLADGSQLLAAATTTGTSANTLNAVSQGSYQVRLVHSGEDGSVFQPTRNTSVSGTVGSGPNGDGSPASATLSQVVIDRNGAAHTATITLQQVADGSRSYAYNVSIPAGGAYPAAQTFGGTLSFDADGSIAQVDGNPPGTYTRSVTLQDSTAAGQPWTLDFSRLVENQHEPMVTTVASTSSATADGSGGPATTGATFTGNLDDTSGAAATTASVTVVDRLGVSRTLTLNLSQATAGGTGASNDQWAWTVDAASIAAFGTGTATSTSTGTIDFSGAGTTPNAGGTGSVTITDAAGVSQTIAVDFSALTNVTGASTAAGTADDGAAGAPTTTVAVTASLNSDGGSTTAAFSVRDRTGVDTVAGNALQLSHLGGNTWSYTITPAGAGFTGTGTNLTGTVRMDGAGNVVSVNGIAGNTIATSWDTTAGEPQPVAFDFSGVGLAPGVARAASNGSAGAATTSMTGGGALASGHAVSDSVTTAAFQAFDRTGAAHSVSITYTKTSTSASGETWSYSINGLDGSVWTGANSGNTSGTLSFDTAGALTAINGGTPAAFSVTVGDGTSAGQSVSVNLTGLSITGAADTVTASQGGGASGTPTTVITLSDNLVSGSTPETVPLDLFDRTGTQLAATSATTQPAVTFSQIGSSNTWSYTITAPSGSGFTGTGTSLQGQVTFDDAGNLVELDGVTTLSKTINFDDGTSGGQPVTMDFASLNMARATDLSASSTDGGSGSGSGEVDAVIYFSDGTGNTSLTPVSTLYGVDLQDRFYSAGGISFTVNQSTTLDVGLTSYVKAYTYQSAVVVDDSLQFQVGSDEGQVQRVGIGRMDAYAIFRLNENNGGTASFTDLTVEDALKAQDLIGQIDDALDYVSGQNLKVGAFHNSLSRTLDLQRQNHTSISGAFSLINDADMAMEATNQAKRSILVQSGTAMVAQANSQAQYILQLLR